jgi:hypothetical protein
MTEGRGLSPIDYEDLLEGPAVGPDEGVEVAPGAATPTDEAPAAPTEVVGPAERPSEVGATREGVAGDHFRVGAHAPMTFDGAPLNLAEDPIIGFKGYIHWINVNGGINGLKARLFLEDDRYTTAGGRQAADRLVNEVRPFFITGTLGIDQVHRVAVAAKERGIPYMAGGGPEPEFQEITDMYQIISNYDQYADMVVDFICNFGPEYVGGLTSDDVRLGTTTLNSDFILPTERRFVAKLEERGCVRTPVDQRARGTINKPTEQSTYQGQMIDLRTAYSNQGANLIVPLQDPVTTARQVLEWTGSGYRPMWTIANFAHDSDTALTLFQGQWTGMRIMSGACYYHPRGGGDPYNRDLCAQMGEAYQQWINLGPVTYDENSGGCVGGHCSYDYNEGSWEEDGSGGASGYQLTYFWEGAMRAIGTDPTREKFLAALNDYDQYSNLITGPITFRGSPNPMIGATKFVLLEGQSNRTWRQVVEVTPGLVDHF